MPEEPNRRDCVKRYPIDSLQIYFAASLEIQEELINHGFYVPSDKDERIRMPIPIIYANFRGWLREPEPITIERLIPPAWLGTTDVELGWRHTFRGGKDAYFLPVDEVYTDVCISEGAVIFDLIIKGYHLERTSIRGVNPDKWTNWAMLYIDFNYIDELIDLLKKYISEIPYRSLREPSLHVDRLKPQKEVQQRGKEVTYFVPVRVRDFELCMGCFDLAQRYLYFKAKEHCKLEPSSEVCVNTEEVIKKLRLKLKYSPAINTYAKVGVAKIAGKRPQIMVKLASEGPEKVIRGILKPTVRGKARGDLVYCNHEVKRQYVALDLVEFYRALIITRSYVDKLPKET